MARDRDDCIIVRALTWCCSRISPRTQETRYLGSQARLCAAVGCLEIASRCSRHGGLDTLNCKVAVSTRRPKGKHLRPPFVNAAQTQAPQFPTLYAGGGVHARVPNVHPSRWTAGAADVRKELSKRSASEADDQPSVGCCIVRPFAHWPRVRLMQMGLFLLKPVNGKCSPGRSLQVRDKWKSCLFFLCHGVVAQDGQGCFYHGHGPSECEHSASTEWSGTC
ncbi:hypothetical protein IWX48DRAFT_105386 [Phyllosticta citricarpa]